MNPDTPPLRLAFARGVAPAKWAKRWAAISERPLELLADPLSGQRPDADVRIMRTAPGGSPDRMNGIAAARGDAPALHAVHLYTEALALVVPSDHELAEETEIPLADLEALSLLDHADHADAWPAAEPWAEAAWMPRDAAALVALVATGTGCALLPYPLARHITDKRSHALIRVTGDPSPAGGEIWAVWPREAHEHRADSPEPTADLDDIQVLIGVFRGRTARSGRGQQHSDEPAASAPAKNTRPAKKTTKALKPNSRGAQLAAAKEKAERARAAKRQVAKKRKRR